MAPRCRERRDHRALEARGRSPRAIWVKRSARIMSRNISRPKPRRKWTSWSRMSSRRSATASTDLAWMLTKPKVKAKKKLANFTTKISLSDRWKDYGSLEIRADDLFGNALRANQWQHDDNISRLGGPIRRWEWGMTPVTRSMPMPISG